MILDACHDNPFVDVPDFSENGLAEMKAPVGTYFAYSTGSGQIALDGDGRNSPFTAALAQEIVKPGQPIEQVFKNVRLSVLEQTAGVQTPWDASSLTANFRFIEPRPLTPAEAEERQLWRSVQASRDALQLMLSLRAYPDDRLSEEARALLAEAVREETAERPAELPKTTSPAGIANASKPTDEAAFQLAQKTGSIAGHQAYLEQYPNGVFAQIATIEIEALSNGESVDPVEPAAEVPKRPVVAVAPPQSGDAPAITFRNQCDRGLGQSWSSGSQAIKTRDLLHVCEQHLNL